MSEDQTNLDLPEKDDDAAWQSEQRTQRQQYRRQTALGHAVTLAEQGKIDALPSRIVSAAKEFDAFLREQDEV